jgi:hypothetical protein
MAGTVVGEAFVAIRPQTEGFAAEAQSKIAAPLQAAFAGIATGVVAAKVKSFFESSFSEATDAAKVTAQTGAVLKSTGEIAGVTAGHVENLAGKLSNLAAVDDEVIQQGENVLLTFTSIRNEAGKGNDVFDRATEAALNMSAALGTDLQGSIIQVGKALQDPIAGLTALRRVGVSFSDSQKELIATLVQSGDLLGAQKIILAELEKEFGGAAASQATATARLSVAFKNLEESIGTALLPLINGLAKALTPLADFLSQNKTAATALAVVLSGALVAGLAAWTLNAAKSTIQTLSFGHALQGTTQQVEQAAAKFAYSSQFNQKWADSLTTSGTAAAQTAASTTSLASGLGLAAGIMGTAAIAGIGLANALGQDARALEVNVHALEGLTQAQFKSFAAQVQASGGFIKLDDIIRKIGGTAPVTARALVAAADLPRAARERLLTTIDKEVAAEARAQKAALGTAGALDTQSDSTSTLIDWVNILEGKLNDQVDASLGTQGAAVSMDRAIQSLNETLFTNAQGSIEARDATIQAEQSVVAFGKKLYDEKLGVEDSTSAMRDQIGALAGVRDSLAPGNPLRTFLDGYINDLQNRIPRDVHTDFLLTLSNQTGLSVGDLKGFEVLSAVLPQFAQGGWVPGPVGTPQLIVAHGGEYVQTAQEAASGGAGPGGNSPTFVFTGPQPPDPVAFGLKAAKSHAVFMAMVGR